MTIYGIWITESDGTAGRWMTDVNTSLPWQGTIREARSLISDRDEYYDVRYEPREYRDLGETHEEVKQLRARNAVLEKIAAAAVYYRETAVRPCIYSFTQQDLACEALDRLLLGFEVAK
jgi:hypothetical protein